MTFYLKFPIQHLLGFEFSIIFMSFFSIFGPLRVGDVDSYELDEAHYYFPPISPPPVRSKYKKQR